MFAIKNPNLLAQVRAGMSRSGETRAKITDGGSWLWSCKVTKYNFIAQIFPLKTAQIFPHNCSEIVFNVNFDYFMNRDLFGEVCEDMTSSTQSDIGDKEAKKKAKASYRSRIYRVSKMHITNGLKTVGKFDMPVVNPYSGTPPESLIPFSRRNEIRKRSLSLMLGLHFYINDPQFICVQNAPDKYVEMFKRFHCVIGLDFSQYANMSYTLRLENNYWSKVFTVYYQNKGVPMVPNVTWSLPDSYEYCFDGHPKNSIIAINSTAIKQHDASIYLWRKGYEEALKRLQPSLILRYGDLMPGENEEISVYYDNEYLNSWLKAQIYS